MSRLDAFKVLLALGALLSAGCLGPPSGQNPPPNPPPPPVTSPNLTAYSTVEEGTGYREFVDFVTMDGSFALAAALDSDWRIAYVYFKGDTIRSWNFSNESSITNRSWTIPGAPCGFDGGVRTLSNHSVLVSCGSNVYSLNSSGGPESSITFSGGVWAFDVAPAAGLIVGGIGEAGSSRLEVRNLTTGELRSSIPVGNGENGSRIMRVTTRSDGALAGILYAPGTTPYLYNLTNGDKLTFGPGYGGIEFARDEPLYWVLKDGGGPKDFGQLWFFDDSSSPDPRQMVDIDTRWTLDASGRNFVFVAPNGSEAGYIAELETTRTYSDGTVRPGTEGRTVIEVFNREGNRTRGIGLPGMWATNYGVEVVAVALTGDGGILAVSVNRTPLHGAEMWLTYGGPASTPPSLVMHNVSA